MSSAISTFPAVNPLAVMIIFVVIPPTIIAIVIRQIWNNYHWRGGFLKKLVSNLGVVLNHHAPLVTCVNLFMGILVFLNQGAYMLNTFSPSNDIKYYLRVDRPEFINYNLIFNAQSLNSIAAIRLQLKESSVRRLDELDVADEGLPSLNILSSDQWMGKDSSFPEEENSRQLESEEKPTNKLNLIYYRSDWDDVISSEQLTDICLTERNILANVDCLETKYDYTFRSFIKEQFNTTTCEYLTSFEDAQAQVGQFVNSRYFSDRTMYTSIRSPILITYLRIGTCGALYSTEEFADLVNAQAVGDTVVQHVSFKFLGDDLSAATDDLRDVMFYSTLFAFLFLIFSVRGIVTAVATLFCVAFSMVNAGALLTTFGYGSFSVYNTASLLVLLSVGAGFVHLYGAAWRHTVKRGKNASPQCLMEIFGTVGQGNLLTFLACCLAFFALGTAPVIMMSQLGFFVGMSMFMFFVSFHYIIVPLWVWTSWYTIPSRYHNQMRIYRQMYCPQCLQSKHDRVQHEHHHHHHDNTEGGTERHHAHMSNLLNAGEDSDHSHDDDYGEEGYRHSDSDSESVSTVSVPEVVVAVAADQVRFASAAEGAAAADIVEAVATSWAEGDDDGGNIGYEDDYQQDMREQEDVDAGGATRGRRKKKRNNQVDAIENGVPAADSGAPAGAVTTNTTTAPAQSGGTTAEEGDDWNFSLTAICQGKRPVKLLGFVMVLLTLFLILLSSVLTSQRMETNFAYAQLVNEPSNLATVLRIFQFHRGDVFYGVDDDNSATIEIPDNEKVSSKHVVLRTKRLPAGPVVPGSSSSSGGDGGSGDGGSTGELSSGQSTWYTEDRGSGSRGLTNSTESEDGSGESFTDFRITGCWGLSPKKLYFDAGVDPDFDYYSFRDYMEKDHEGIVGDFVATCDYVDSHRAYLNVHPDWNRTTDCIADQYLQVYNSTYFELYNTTKRTVANTLIAWGTSYANAETMVGLFSNETMQATIPVWVCANFTGRTMNLLTFQQDMELGTEMRQRWENVFYKHGNKYAKQNGISTVVGSTEFTFPLLGRYITALVQYQAAVFIIGFPLLFLVFTVFDFGLTFFGVLGLFTAYLLTIFIGIYRVDKLIDFGDVVVLVLMLPLLVCFNIHLTSSYMSHRLISQRKAHTHDSSIQFLSPALWKTQLYMIKALTGPMILAVVAAVAFTWSEYPILRRFGYYYMIFSIVAYLFSVVVQPFLLAFSCKSNFCTFEFEEEEGEGGATTTSTQALSPASRPDGDVEMTTRGGGGGGNNRPPPNQQGHRPLRRPSPMDGGNTMSMHNMSRHGSQFQMGSVYHNSSQFAMDNDARSQVSGGYDYPTMQAPRRGNRAGSSINGGSVASRSDLQSRASEADDFYDVDDSGGYDPSASQYMIAGGEQQRGVAYGDNYPGDMPAPAYGYAGMSSPQQQQQQQYDEYSRPVQMVLMAPQPQPQIYVAPPPQQVYVQSPPAMQQPVYVQQSPPQPQYVSGYRRVPTVQTMIPPPAVQQQYYYPQQQQQQQPPPAYYPLQQQQGYDDDDQTAEQYTEQGDDDDRSQYTTGSRAQMYPPARPPQQQPQVSAAPSFYSNGRSALAARQAMQQSMQNLHAASASTASGPAPVTGYRRDANPNMRSPVPPYPRPPVHPSLQQPHAQGAQLLGNRSHYSNPPQPPPLYGRGYPPQYGGQQSQSQGHGHGQYAQQYSPRENVYDQ